MGIMVHGDCYVCGRVCSYNVPSEWASSARLYCSDKCRNYIPMKNALSKVLGWVWHLIFPAKTIKVLPAKKEEVVEKEDKANNSLTLVQDTTSIVPMPDYKRMFFDVVKENEETIYKAKVSAFSDPQFPPFCKVAFQLMLDRVNGLSQYDFFMDHDFKHLVPDQWTKFCFAFDEVCKDIGIESKYVGDNSFHFTTNTVKKLLENPPPDLDEDMYKLLTQGPYR